MPLNSHKLSSTRCLSFSLSLSISPSFFFVLRSSLQLQSRNGRGWRNPPDNSSGHGHSRPVGHPYSTRHFPGKHLLSSLAYPHILAGNANQSPSPEAELWRARGAVPWEPQGKARAFGKDKQEDRTLSPLICTSRHHWLIFN